MLRLALLEMAGFILCRGATTRMVQALSETLRHRRNQRIVLLVAYGGERSGVAARARQEEVCLHCKSLRAHYPREEIQGHENSHKGLRNDRRRSRRSNGVLSFSAAAELWLHQDTAQGHRKSARSLAAQRRRIQARQLVERGSLQRLSQRRHYLLLLQRAEVAR